MSELKLCKDCKHYTENGLYPYPMCAVGKVEPVRGMLDEMCSLARKEFGSCGAIGKNFEQKPEPVQPEVPEGYKIYEWPDKPDWSLPPASQEQRPWWKLWGKA